MALCDFSEQMKDVIVHGARMADVLKKGLCLLAVWKGKDQKILVQEKMAQITRNLKSNLPALKISSLLIQSSLRRHIEKLVEDYEAVLMVLHQNVIQSELRAFRESSIPFLFINGSSPECLQYKNVFVPVDFRKASKEASLWASYLGRFNKSQIYVIYAFEKDGEEKIKLQRNVEYFKKFLSSLNISHHLIAGKSSSWGIWKEALGKANAANGDVMIYSGSNSVSLLDLLIGLPEKKIIAQAGKVPVLLINPRKDICVLCD